MSLPQARRHPTRRGLHVLGVSRLIAVDLDGVLGDQVSHVLSRFGLEAGMAVNPDEITTWNSPVGNEPFDKLIERYLADPKFVRTMPTVTGAEEGMRQLSRYGELVVLTTRPRSTARETRRWVHLHFGNDVRIEIAPIGGKSAFPASILIDDNLENVADFIRSRPARVAILFSRPWNEDRESASSLLLSGRLQIAHGWGEVTALFHRPVWNMLGHHQQIKAQPS